MRCLEVISTDRVGRIAALGLDPDLCLSIWIDAVVTWIVAFCLACAIFVLYERKIALNSVFMHEHEFVSPLYNLSCLDRGLCPDPCPCPDLGLGLFLDPCPDLETSFVLLEEKRDGYT